MPSALGRILRLGWVRELVWFGLVRRVAAEVALAAGEDMVQEYVDNWGLLLVGWIALQVLE